MNSPLKDAVIAYVESLYPKHGNSSFKPEVYPPALVCKWPKGFCVCGKAFSSHEEPDLVISEGDLLR